VFVVASIEAGLKFTRAKTVHEAQEYTKHVSVSANFLMVDSQGNIGYQQSGALPIRRE